MSIQTTLFIDRSCAIDRIIYIHKLVKQRNFAGIENVSFETDCDIELFVNQYKIDINNIETWTNRMIERLMCMPFFRTSIFNNYIVRGD